MWKLTIKRSYTKTYSSGDLSCDDYFTYESESLQDLVEIIENNRMFSTNGTFEYTLVYESKGV